ncbi:unnamed protein product [Sphenostylis stenocarpa]|uniref:Uncharacterized protein n=1 Tax=Sphenostylis stenocarpa TaxID=92480 RepID=A0AA86W2C6_9FABA|nr:unnamed protein product [Sphenostylis stenocarpa]
MRVIRCIHEIHTSLAIFLPHHGKDRKETLVSHRTCLSSSRTIRVFEDHDDSDDDQLLSRYFSQPLLFTLPALSINDETSQSVWLHRTLFWYTFPFQLLDLSSKAPNHGYRAEKTLGASTFKRAAQALCTRLRCQIGNSSTADEIVESFAQGIQIIGYIRHRSIVRLIAHCQEGLAYLHHENRDVKCNNIHPDSKFEVYPADFGLAMLMDSLNYHHAIGFYEYNYSMNLTEKSDVSSYGEVLLEILSGCSAAEDGQTDTFEPACMCPNALSTLRTVILGAVSKESSIAES